jgi:hypothetical protein
VVLMDMDINTGLARRWEGQRTIQKMARGTLPHYLATLFTRASEQRFDCLNGESQSEMTILGLRVAGHRCQAGGRVHDEGWTDVSFYGGITRVLSVGPAMRGEFVASIDG